MTNLVELFDNIVQMQNLNGVPLANGRMYVYALGRTRLMDTWSDVDGESLNTNPIILDAAGQCHCFVSDDFDYTVVVCDAYDNEVFSLDKYLYSKGSHSHADVAVAPSEFVGVSSYHVGETTVYVPYLTGDVGKTYEGIDPIVVNNVEDKISANHVPLGVQEPLYFVQDDEEGCILGCSGDTEPYVNHDRTIKIDDHVVSTDMQAVMIRQQINNSSIDYKYAKICEADLNTVTWINEWMTTLQLNFQSCGPYYEGKSFGTFVLNCENYVQSRQTYVQKHEEDGKWVIFAKDNNSPQIVKLYLYWRDDSSSQHYELWGEFANLKYYEAVGVAAILNCSLRNHLTSSLPIDQERNIWRFNSIGIETLKNALPTGMNLVGQYLPDDASIKPVSDDSAGTFYATYTYDGPDSGNTPYDDIKAAYDAGKAIFVKFKESSASTETEIFSLVGFWEVPNRPDLNRFQFQNLDQWSGKTIYRFPSSWGKMSDHNFALQDNLWDLTQSIAPDDFLVPIPSPSGVYCTRNYEVYKALEPITSNTWVESAWTKVNVMDEIYNLQNKEENHDIFVAEYPTTDASAVQSALSAGKYVVTKLGYDFIPVVYSDEYRAIFCGLQGGNSAGAGGCSIDVDFGTGWSDPVNIPFATYPGVQGMISSKMDASASGSFITALPSDLATTGWVDSQGYLTAVDIPESAVWNATTQTVSANSAQWAGSTANPQIPVSSTSGISIFESGDKVYFNISADYADKDWVTAQGYLTAETDWTDTITAASANAYEQATAAIPPAFDPSYISAQVDTKLDSAIYAADSGTFLTALPRDLVYTADIADMATTGDLTGKQDSLTFGYHDTAISSIDNSAVYDNSAHARINTLAGRISDLSSNKLDTTAFSTVSGDFLTAVDLTPYQEKADMTAYATVESLTAKQDAGSYLSANALDNLSGNWETVTAKLDTTAFSDVSGTFLTAHQDLSDYQTTAGMTAYQSAGDYLTTADSGNFYPSNNPSAFITGVDLTPYQLTADMTAYQTAGSYLSANALNNISGDWNEVSAKLDTTAFSNVSGNFLTAHQPISANEWNSTYNTVSHNSASWGQGGGGGGSLTPFTAIYGSTDYDNIWNAWDQGRLVYVQTTNPGDPCYFPLNMIDTENDVASFGGMFNGTYYYFTNDNGSWSQGSR